MHGDLIFAGHAGSTASHRPCCWARQAPSSRSAWHLTTGVYPDRDWPATQYLCTHIVDGVIAWLIAGEPVRPSECNAIVAAINLGRQSTLSGAGADRLAFEFADIPGHLWWRKRDFGSVTRCGRQARGPSIRRRQPTGYIGGRWIFGWSMNRSARSPAVNEHSHNTGRPPVTATRAPEI